jgi:hypothetical protein
MKAHSRELIHAPFTCVTFTHSPFTFHISFHPKIMKGIYIVAKLAVVAYTTNALAKPKYAPDEDHKVVRACLYSQEACLSKPMQLTLPFWHYRHSKFSEVCIRCWQARFGFDVTARNTAEIRHKANIRSHVAPQSARERRAIEYLGEVVVVCLLFTGLGAVPGSGFVG